MSIIVYDFTRKSMIADTISTWGAHASYAAHKVHHGKVGRYEVLLGIAGIPGLAAPVESFIMAYLDDYNNSNSDLSKLAGIAPKPNKFVFEEHFEWLERLNQNVPESAKNDFTVLIAIRDPKSITNNIMVGVCDNMMQPIWNILPQPDMDRVCVAGLQASAAFNGSKGRFDAAGVVHSIGNPRNTYFEYTFDGKVKPFDIKEVYEEN